MAGTFKPNIEGLAREAKYEAIEGNFYRGTYQNLFDQADGRYSSYNACYWYSGGNYVEVDIKEHCNIWRVGASDYPGYNRACRIEKFINEQWVEQAIPQLEESVSGTTWSKWISNLPKGRYRFYKGAGYRMDAEWYIEFVDKSIQKKIDDLKFKIEQASIPDKLLYQNSDW